MLSKYFSTSYRLNGSELAYKPKELYIDGNHNGDNYAIYHPQKGYKLDADIEAMEDLIDESKQAAVQLWAYNPGLLTANGVVDRLSLACSYGDEDDDRINIELEEMLDNMWENGYGKGF